MTESNVKFIRGQVVRPVWDTDGSIKIEMPSVVKDVGDEDGDPDQRGLVNGEVYHIGYLCENNHKAIAEKVVELLKIQAEEQRCIDERNGQ